MRTIFIIRGKPKPFRDTCFIIPSDISAPVLGRAPGSLPDPPTAVAGCPGRRQNASGLPRLGRTVTQGPAGSRAGPRAEGAGGISLAAGEPSLPSAASPSCEPSPSSVGSHRPAAPPRPSRSRPSHAQPPQGPGDPGRDLPPRGPHPHPGPRGAARSQSPRPGRRAGPSRPSPPRPARRAPSALPGNADPRGQPCCELTEGGRG